jgi:transcriptional regulator with XRE-family HTH domain
MKSTILPLAGARGRRGLRLSRGYSLVEVLAACGIVALGVGAALSLSLATVSQEETGHRIARAVAIGENAARLYGLGLSPDEIVRILPPDPVLSSISIREDEMQVDGVGAMDRAQFDIVFHTSRPNASWVEGQWSGGPGGESSKRNLPVITALRPKVRSGF